MGAGVPLLGQFSEPLSLVCANILWVKRSALTTSVTRELTSISSSVFPNPESLYLRPYLPSNH
jgi:hypothetical protein